MIICNSEAKGGNARTLANSQSVLKRRACARGNLSPAEKRAFWKFKNRMVEKMNKKEFFFWLDLVGWIGGSFVLAAAWLAWFKFLVK